MTNRTPLPSLLTSGSLMSRLHAAWSAPTSTQRSLQRGFLVWLVLLVVFYSLRQAGDLFAQQADNTQRTLQTHMAMEAAHRANSFAARQQRTNAEPAQPEQQEGEESQQQQQKPKPKPQNAAPSKPKRPSLVRSGRDPWSVCPAEAVLDPVRDAARITAERARLGLDRCHPSLFPSGPILVAPTISHRNQSRLLWSMPPLDKDTQHKCRQLCAPVLTHAGQHGFTEWDHEWRGPDPPDVHLHYSGGQKSRRIHTREFVGAQAFRDQAEWNVFYVYKLHNEPICQRDDFDAVLQCLPPGAAVGFYGGSPARMCEALLPRLKQPIILLLGGTDEDRIRECEAAFTDRNVLHIYAQNVDAPRHLQPKLTQAPGGLNNVEHQFLSRWLILQHVRDTITKQRALQSKDGKDSSSSSNKEECAMQNWDETYSTLIRLEPCVDSTMECSHEMSRLGLLLGLDEYAWDERILELNRRAVSLVEDFDPAEIRVFFEEHRATYGELHLQVPKRWDVDQSKDHSLHDQRTSRSMLLPRELDSWNQADQSKPIDFPCSLPQPPAHSYSMTSEAGPLLPLFGRYYRLAVVNFARGNNPRLRGAIVDTFCNARHAHWVTCIDKSQGNSMHGDNPHLLSLWSRLSEYLYWFSPFGVGMDCHRTWEALYVGSVPILLDSPLNAIWQDADLPVLIVKDYTKVTPELLLAHAPRFANQHRDFSRRKLMRAYWRYQILRQRHIGVQLWRNGRDAADAAASTDLSPLVPDDPEAEPLVADWLQDRPRCWGTHLQPMSGLTVTVPNYRANGDGDAQHRCTV